MSSCIILISPYSSIIGLKDPVCFILTFELGETTGEIAGVNFDIFDFVAEETLFWDWMSDIDKSSDFSSMDFSVFSMIALNSSTF